MADADSIKQLEARLTRLEAAMAQQPSAAAAANVPGGAITDPAPFPQGGYGGWGYPRWPHPITDPAPFPGGGYGGWGYHPWPHPIVDPAAFHRPIVDPAAFHRPIVDPAVFAQAAQSNPAAAATFGRISAVADPPPIDISRFSISQLETSLHSINAEKARLTSMETMINQQLEKLKKQG
jgi:hypothetical protein